jgi:hypothetical protein
MTLRVYFLKRGAHVHCRVFAGKTGVTLAHVGELVFGAEEWREARAELSKIADLRDEGADLHGTVNSHG